MLPLVFLLVSLNFVDTPIEEVVRSLSLAYDVPLLVDGNLDSRVTFHLEGVELLEGLGALCEAYGLELTQSGDVFHVRRAQVRGVHEFSKRDSLISISVKQKNISDFIREFGSNTGLNVLGMEGLEGQVNGDLHDVPAEEALRLLMLANGFRLIRDGNAFRVGKGSPGLLANDEKLESGHVRFHRDGELYTIEANEAPLGLVLQELSDVSGVNLALYGDMGETVRLRLCEVTLEDLLEVLFRGRRYGYTLEGNTLFVAAAGNKEALLQNRLYPLKHVHWSQALGYLSRISPGPSFVAVEVKEQNGLLLSGNRNELKVAEDLLSRVDVPALQVTLSCIIVEFKRGNVSEIGLHSGANRKTGEMDVGLRGFLDFSNASLSKTGAFGRIGLLPDRFELELAALEETNSGTVLARPKLTTLNGNKAELNVTNTVYYLVSQVSADGYPITDYRSFNDGISLEITPLVTQDGSITLDISPEIKTAGRSSGDGPRDISTRNLKTVVMLKDGESFCLGGLIRRTKSEVRSSIPFLGSLPLVGKIFSYVSEVDEENELAIFITPRVEGYKENPAGDEGGKGNRL